MNSAGQDLVARILKPVISRRAMVTGMVFILLCTATDKSPYERKVRDCQFGLVAL